MMRRGSHNGAHAKPLSRKTGAPAPSRWTDPADGPASVSREARSGRALAENAGLEDVEHPLISSNSTTRRCRLTRRRIAAMARGPEEGLRPRP